MSLRTEKPTRLKSRIPKKYIGNVIRSAISKNIFANDHSSVVFYDLQMIRDRVEQIQKIFPENSLHALAIKANPLTAVLKKMKTLGVGMEAASKAELFLAYNSGFDADKIVFDSPAKTLGELKYALELGVYINADSFQELDRIANIYPQLKSASNIGLRINPQIGTGTIKSTSVADKISKFGIPIKSYKNNIIKAYLSYSWLDGIHLHIGSQGISREQLLDGLKVVYDLALEINVKLKPLGRKLMYFDIGGGFPVSYSDYKKGEDIGLYAESIKECFPGLYDGTFRVITEFGRYIYANAAFAVSRVEYVKTNEDHKIVSIHLGADFLLRKAYNPNDWHHEITVHDKEGNLKNGKDTVKYIVAGPLCFAGDIIANGIDLPEVETGDYIVIHDVGAYTLSMWSRYNSREIPKVLGYDEVGRNFEVLKEREKVEDIYNFWS